MQKTKRITNKGTRKETEETEKEQRVEKVRERGEE